MSKHVFTVMFSATLLVGGCASRDAPDANAVLLPPLPPKPAHNANLCPVYKAPVLPPKPEAPLKQLEALNPHDESAINKLARNYIIQLSSYIDQTHDLMTRSYQDYLRQCHRFQKSR